MTYLTRLQKAVALRESHNINARLKSADEIWSSDYRMSDNCRTDAGVNHLKKKIWTLYSIMQDQLTREGDEALFLSAIEPDITEISSQIANELLDEILDLINSENGDSEISFTQFMSMFDIAYRRNLKLVLQKASIELNRIEDLLTDSMFSGNNLREIKRALLDLCMYPNAYILGAYKVSSTSTTFKSGRLTASSKSYYSFHRLNPWTVFPENPIRLANSETNYFVIEEYSVSKLKELKGIKGANDSAIQNVIDNSSKYNVAWYVANCRHFPSLDMSDIPVAKFIGSEDGEESEVWFVGEEIIYEARGRSDSAIVMSATFRPSNDLLYGSGVVDAGWRLQKTIDKLSEMMVSNIGHRSTPGGMIPKSLIQSIPKNAKGVRKIDYKKIYSVDDDIWLRGMNIRAFDVPDRSVQLQSTINMFKNEMDSILGIPAFADGSQSVGTLGRSYQGLFLVQSNMMMSIKSVWNLFADNILVRLAERVINGELIEGNLSTPSLDFQVRVKPFYVKEENLKDADSIIKQVQAIRSMQEAQLVPQGAEEQLVQDALLKLGVNPNIINPESIPDPTTNIDQIPNDVPLSSQGVDNQNNAIFE